MIYNKNLLTITSSRAILDLQDKIIENKSVPHRMDDWKGCFSMNDKLTQFTKYLLDLMFYAGIIVIATLPLSIKLYGRFNSYFAENYYSLCLLFFLSGIFAVLIVQQLRKMFRTVLEDNCFIHENVVSLEKMSIYSFFIAVITACRLFLYLTPAVLIIILVFVIAGLFSKVLAGVFDKAITYKQENDLTI